MSADRIAVLESLLSRWKTEVDSLSAENAEFKSHNEYLQGDAGLADMVIDRLKADNAELRKLVLDAFIFGIEAQTAWRFRSGDLPSVAFEKWITQHPVLQQDPNRNL